MISLINNVKFYLKLYLVFFKNSISANMEYRMNFIMGFFVECAFICIKSLYIVVTYQTGLTINGLTPDSILLFIGTYTFITGIMSLIYFPNFIKISQYVKDGTLDIYMVKPVSLQFIISLRYIDLGWAAPNVIGGLAMIIISLVRQHIQLTLFQVLGFILFNISSLIITYSILLLPELLAFWVVNVDSLHQLIYGFWDFNNMPMHIYGKTLRRIGIYVVPIFVITNFPPLFMLNQLTTLNIIWGGLVAPALTFFLTRIIWNTAIKRYESASS